MVEITDMNLGEKKYKVVIECATFNQRNYIEDALKGFVMQKTTFPFCAIVIDDCSTDGQQEIIRKYAEQYPDIIKPIFLPFNHFTAKKSKQEYLEPFFMQSEYIAKCEGDDYWTDENKLQIQADFLDADPDCALTYHACKNVFEANYTGLKKTIGQSVEEEYNYTQLLQNYHFQTATIMLRRSVWFNPFFQRCYAIFSGDTVQYFAASQLGTVKGIDKQLSVYRRCNSGISGSIHRGELSFMMFQRWYSIAGICSEEISNQIHKITICSYLYQIHKTSYSNFLKAILKETPNHPGIVFSAVKRIIKSKIKHIISSRNLH